MWTETQTLSSQSITKTLQTFLNDETKVFKSKVLKSGFRKKKIKKNKFNIKLEKEIDNFAIRAQKELILLHRMDGSRPTNTVKWMNARSWCSSHHHIRCSEKLLNTKTNEKLVKYLKRKIVLGIKFI